MADTETREDSRDRISDETDQRTDRHDRRSASAPHTHVRRRRVSWAPWSPAQVIVAILGGFLIVLGTLALSNTGLGEWTSPTTEVWGFGHTPLMAVIEIGLGLIFLITAPDPFSARGTLLGFGVLMAVFGIVTLVDADAFQGALGVNRQIGLFYLIGGIAAFVLGGLAPIFDWQSDEYV